MSREACAKTKKTKLYPMNYKRNENKYSPTKEWFAGFFDGEGCVRIQIDSSKKCKTQTSLVVSVTNIDIRPIILFSNKFPGYKNHICCTKWLNRKYHLQYEWMLRKPGRCCKYS